MNRRFTSSRTTRLVNAWNRRHRHVRIIGIIVQHNGRQIMPFPTKGPDPWMWYVYAKTQDVPMTYYGGWDGDQIRYLRTNYAGPIGMGRNPQQAWRHYNEQVRQWRR